MKRQRWRSGRTDGAPCEIFAGRPCIVASCRNTAGGGGAALEAVVLDGVDVFLDVWPEVLRAANAPRICRIRTTVSAPGPPQSPLHHPHPHT